MGLELGVVVWELIVEDGDGHAVQDDAEGDAGEGEDATQVGLWEHVAVTHRGNTHLWNTKGYGEFIRGKDLELDVAVDSPRPTTRRGA